ncbi:hypothetical protein CU098_008080 [Rhizopus stolonifer]|uniref:Chloride channel protein n=1 Tax=Rhizopus stolonifer TaxID=4846 RepID=A0A367KI11_RHIST|nr:hypothetical protein CU098_008080 [Rhizopus stolonifer]
MPDETTLLLQRTESSKGHYDPTLKFRPLYKRTGPYDEDEQGLVQENTGVRVWSESYSSIDWIHDRIKEGVRKRKLRHFQGFRGYLKRSSDGAQAWILVGMIGTTVAMIAWCIDVVQEWMSDIKQGYCTTGWQKNQKFCCTDTQDVCDAWKTWSSLLTQHETMYYTSMAIYTAFGLFFSLIAASMVKYTRERVRVRKGTQTVFSKSSSMASLLHVVDSVQTPEYETKTVYYSAGSGIPEVKVILSGFVIKGFLGIKTLIVKSIGMIFSTSAGLNVGKEGPFVHLACSAGNIACRLFPKFNKNESKEILSASAAAGVAVAFGAPIGGVLFSLEEVSYYFPMKTMIRSYCCAMVAAVVLKIMDPFGTQKIVLFQVSYDKDYHLFELIPFIVCAVFSGLLGTFVTHLNIKYQELRKSSFISKYPVIEVLCIMLTTSLVSYWNPFARQNVSEIPHLIYLLITTLVIKMGLTIITFGCPVPGGIFLPSLIIGAVTGRIIGLVMQYLTLSFPESFSACDQDFANRGECILPGVYAIVGAAASLASVTRTTISLVVIMFELTYSLTYAIPIMVSVMISNWVAGTFFVEGIYDLLIQLRGYPYLETGREYIHTESITSIIETLPVIEGPVNIEQLRRKLNALSTLGYVEDGGFPILSNHILEGYIAINELSHGLEQLEKRLRKTLTEEEVGKIPCYFKAQGGFEENTHRHLLIRSNSTETKEDFNNLLLNDFSQYIDHAPLSIHENTSMTLLVDIFSKLGASYVCVRHSDGSFMGIIHKRRLLAYLKEE